MRALGTSGHPVRSRCAGELQPSGIARSSGSRRAPSGRSARAANRRRNRRRGVRSAVDILGLVRAGDLCVEIAAGSRRRVWDRAAEGRRVHATTAISQRRIIGSLRVPSVRFWRCARRGHRRAF